MKPVVVGAVYLFRTAFRTADYGAALLPVELKCSDFQVSAKLNVCNVMYRIVFGLTDKAKVLFLVIVSVGFHPYDIVFQFHFGFSTQICSDGC